MEKKYQKVLISEANLQHTFYNYDSQIQPCGYFWKQLVRLAVTPRVLIPDTLILNDKQTSLLWIYTSASGHLQKSTLINFKDFIAKVTNYCSPNELSATIKRVTYNDNYINGNDVKLVNSRYLQNTSVTQLTQGDAIVVLQKFVKSNGNNAFICRTILRKNSNSQCFIITNKKSFYDVDEPQNKRFLVKASTSSKRGPSTCLIVKSIQGKHLQQTCKQLKSITDYMKLYRGITISQIVGDFIKDESGLWWLTNIKAFQIQQKLIKSPSLKEQINQLEIISKVVQSHEKQKQKYQKTKICRYCQKSYLQSELNHVMTIKMLIQTDRYLLHMGKNYQWLKRSDIQNVDSHCLYQEHKICQRCYRLYMEIQQLMQVQKDFLKKLGFQMQKTPKQLLMGLTNQQALKNESKNKQIATLAQRFSSSGQKSFPKTIQLGPNSNITFEQDCPIKNDQMINKMIRYRMIFYIKEIDQIQLPVQLANKNYLAYNFYVEYQLFGIKNRIRLDFHNNFDEEKKLLKIKKLKVNYFFSHSHQDVNDYLNGQQQNLDIKIIMQQKQQKSLNMNSFLVNDSMVSQSKVLLKKSNSIKNINNTKTSSIKNSTNIKQHHKATTSNLTQAQSPQRQRYILGNLELPIKDIFSNLINPNPNKICKKDFYKFFSLNNVTYGWGLQGSIGILPTDGYFNTTRMIFFTNNNLIYLPSDTYYYCQQLTQEWVDLIKKQLPNYHYRESSNYGDRTKRDQNFITNQAKNFTNTEVNIQKVKRSQTKKKKTIRIQQRVTYLQQCQKSILNINKDQTQNTTIDNTTHNQTIKQSVKQNTLFFRNSVISQQAQGKQYQHEQKSYIQGDLNKWKQQNLLKEIMNYEQKGKNNIIRTKDRPSSANGFRKNKNCHINLTISDMKPIKIAPFFQSVKSPKYQNLVKSSKNILKQLYTN